MKFSIYFAFLSLLFLTACEKEEPNPVSDIVDQGVFVANQGKLK